MHKVLARVVRLSRFILVLLVISGRSFTVSLNGAVIANKKSITALNAISVKESSPRAKLLAAEQTFGVRAKVGNEFPQVRGMYDRLTFGWVKELMVKGNRKPLELDNIWLLDENKRMRKSSESFERLFEMEKTKSLLRSTIAKQDPKTNVLLQFWKSPVTRAIVALYKKDLLATGCLKLINTFVQFAPSLIISRILNYVSRSRATPAVALVTLHPALYEYFSPTMLISLEHLHQLLHNEGFLLSMLLFTVLCAKTAIENQYFDAISRMSSEMRGTLSTAVYRKALKLSAASRQNNTMGEIMNYMQLDAGRLEQVAHSIHTVWDGALQIVGYTFLLVQFLGPSVFAGIAAMFIIMPLNSFFLRRISKLRESNLKQTDRRVRLTNEVLQGIRAIKSYNWESPFAHQLHTIRDAELRGIKSAANMRSLLVCALSVAPSLVAVCSLSTYALLGNDLTPTKVFTSLGLFNQLRFPLIFFPMLLNTLAEGKVSLRRLTAFLLADEVQNYVQKDDSPEEIEAKPLLRREAVRIVNGTFTWSNDPETIQNSRLSYNRATSSISSAPSLERSSNASADNPSTSTVRDRLTNIDLSIRKGHLVAIVGPTGSGKSTLLHALLGELHKASGQVVVKGEVSYVPQAAWIPNDTLRNVILFGLPMDWRRYQHTLRICGLEKDLELLENGDQTEIGERGANLSGGQRQRVSMARAVYENVDVYLMDDPLSALDSDVGARLFSDCIKQGLAGKTRLLVTHNLAVLSQVDRIVLMNQTEDGSACGILDQGTLRELLRRGHDLTKYVKPTEESSSKESVSTDVRNIESSATLLAPATSASVSSSLSEGSTLNVTNVLPVTAAEASASLYESSVPPSGGLVDLTDNSVLTATEIQLALDVEPQVSSEEIGLPKLKKEEDDLLLENGPHEGEKTEDEDEDNWNDHSSHKDEELKEVVTDSTRSKSVVKLMTKEDRAQGAVGLKMYQFYLHAANKPLLLALLGLAVLLGNASYVWQQWVVSAWTSDVGYQRRPLHMYLLATTGMALLVGMFSYLRTYFGVLVGVAASKTIHRDMTERVMAAPLAFFESTPTGRLMQRFSKDLDQIDQQLPYAFGQLISSTCSILSSVGAIIAVTPSFSYPLTALFAVYFTVINYYRNVARELKRLEAISRSPIYSHFSETLSGLSVIRAFQRQKLYLRHNEARLDENISAFSTMKVVDRWLCVRLELLGNTVVLLSALLAVLTRSKAGAAGLSLNSALGVTSLLNWAVRNAADTENLMTSVERVAHTIRETPQEALRVAHNVASNFSSSAKLSDSTESTPSTSFASPIVTLSDADLLKSGWPWEGRLSLNNVRMRYRRDFEPVLKGVDLEIKPGERIGIVGRTGSGKSSLFRALLRLTELEEGSIQLDGVDISKIGLDALRSSLSIIPQDPVLFSGSVRLNLDPFNAHTDAELWSALRKAKLDRTVLGLPGALRYEVAEGGDNFSQGQRQLLCLARALVRRSRVLLLDEATSCVDYETDALVQAAIRSEFGDGQTTVLTIAHRLDSVLEADRIVVMDAGRVAEVASPAELLRDEFSLFSRLVRADHMQRAEKGDE